MARFRIARSGVQALFPEISVPIALIRSSLPAASPPSRLSCRLTLGLLSNVGAPAVRLLRRGPLVVPHRFPVDQPRGTKLSDFAENDEFLLITPPDPRIWVDNAASEDR